MPQRPTTPTTMTAASMSVDGDRPHLTAGRALVALARCVARTGALLARRRIVQPRRHVGRTLAFADGTHARVYRETLIRDSPSDDPVVLGVTFRLRHVHGRGHSLFRFESELNTVLFAGFPGLVSKLWLAHDETAAYRGVYQWDGADRAHDYARTLWWVLSLVSEPGSIHYVVVPGARLADVLAAPGSLPVDPGFDRAWWRPVEPSSPA